MNQRQNFWTCVIGPAKHVPLPNGADLPIRMAVESAFQRMTGYEPEVCITGWGNNTADNAESTIKRELVYAVNKTNTTEPELRKLTSGDLLRLITNFAKDYAKNSSESIKQNHHMNNLSPDESLSQEAVDAVLVDFINYIGSRHCVDYGLYTKDLKEPKVSVDFEV